MVLRDSRDAFEAFFLEAAPLCELVLYSYGTYSYGLYRSVAYIVMAYVVMAFIVMAYVVMACIIMAYVVMAYTVMALYGYGLCSHGPIVCAVQNSYGLYSYGVYSSGLYSYGLCSYGLYSSGPIVCAEQRMKKMHRCGGRDVYGHGHARGSVNVSPQVWGILVMAY